LASTTVNSSVRCCFDKLRPRCTRRCGRQRFGRTRRDPWRWLDHHLESDPTVFVLTGTHRAYGFVSGWWASAVCRRWPRLCQPDGGYVVHPQLFMMTVVADRRSLASRTYCGRER
jgi:hypothetical protein